MTFQTITGKLWDKDPGYFRIKQGLKTILAILIVMIITFTAPFSVKLVAGITAGFAMQAITGQNQKEQFQFILIAFPIYFLCYLIGYITRNFGMLSDIVLAILGFLAMYVRKFGSKFTFAPILAWTFCFFGVIFSIPLQEYFLVVYGLLLGLCISGLVFLLIFPEKKQNLYFNNLKLFFNCYSNALQWLAYILMNGTNLKTYNDKKIALRDRIFHLCLYNGDIAQKYIDSNGYSRLNKLYTKQYALAKNLSMILEGFEHLIITNKILSDIVRSHLFTIIAIYATAISNLHISDTKSNYVKVSSTLKIIETNLVEFQNLILKSFANNSEFIVPLVNINLALQLIQKNIKTLEFQT